ncbi:MAG: hypothetical protein V8Q75_01555 [Bacilli bacterium]
MKINKNGFAFTSLVYMLFLIFMALLFSLLNLMRSRKLILDGIKNDILNEFHQEKIDDTVGESDDTDEETSIYRDSTLNGADPVFTSNMIPVRYDEVNKQVLKASLYEKWYDYTNKKWANIVLVSETNRTVYQNTEAGTVIKPEDILAYLVWIPRYKYYVPRKSNNSIEIVFQDTNQKNYCIDSKKSCANDSNHMITHPSFRFAGHELKGFWVAKFEPSFTDQNLTILPNKNSYLSSDSNWNLQAMFKKTREMEIYHNVYGFHNSALANKVNDGGNINNDNNVVDSHLMKSVDWGAVTYLTMSKYGKNKEPSNNNTQVTGGGDFYSNGSQSTTGNITGIYDMVGGSWEYVMSGTYKEQNYDNKYYDKYNPNSLSTIFLPVYRSGVVGDATHGEYEFSTMGGIGDSFKDIINDFFDDNLLSSHNERNVISWVPDTVYNSDNRLFQSDDIISTKRPYLTRGCNYADGSNSSLFCRYSRDGKGTEQMTTSSGAEVTVSFSFRPVIVITN